jgi:hypothetical protein
MAYAFYRYDPIVAPAVVALILFFITTVFHIYQVSRTRAWYMIPMIVGGLSTILPFNGAYDSVYTWIRWTYHLSQ